MIRRSCLAGTIILCAIAAWYVYSVVIFGMLVEAL